MVKISIEDFTNQAIKNGKFDIQWTVAKVRAWRKENRKKEKYNEEIDDNSKERKILSSQDISSSKDLLINDTIDNIVPQEWEILQEQEKTISISLPDSLEKIKLLISILNNHPWTDTIIIVQNKEYYISKQGMNLLQNMLII